jgi:hypothetical protein
VFFLFLGLISMWIYFATDFAGSPSFWLFFGALGTIILGIFMMRRGYSPPKPSGRFRLLSRNRKPEQDTDQEINKTP